MRLAIHQLGYTWTNRPDRRKYAKRPKTNLHDASSFEIQCQFQALPEADIETNRGNRLTPQTQ